MNEEVKKSMISYGSSCKISSYLVQARLYPINRTVGCYKCGSKRCEVRKYITEADTFTSTVTGGTFKINYRFDCNDKCLVYLLICNKRKNNTMVQLQTTFVVDGTTTNLKVDVLIEENSVCKNICTNILKVKVIQVHLKKFF